MAARFVTRGEEAGVSTVSTLTSGMAADRSEFVRGALVSFSRLSFVNSNPLLFSEFLTVGSNFWVIISCSTKTNQHNVCRFMWKPICSPIRKTHSVNQLTFLSAGGVVGGGVIASGEGSVAVKAAAWEQTK